MGCGREGDRHFAGTRRSVPRRRALDLAKTLGCERLNCLAGVAPPDAAREELEATFLDNLAYAAEPRRGGR